MKRIPLIVSLILSIFVMFLNFSDDSYFNGTVMAIVSVLVLIELIRQSISTNNKSS
ncbi:hypothetical protein [Tuberibacillus sp. Marseille-P3662]|uniref:hypothetical protein n=1 Tax=Tuberibacillus sp. Marseille-P3662 TaxID=1965358 RepID=UPI001593AE10|nr:hypothetical protein [Tuberibacillus sp. Marseille-P3662]